MVDRRPTAAHHTHKQKKSTLQEARRRAREVADEHYFDETPRLVKVVQARLYTYRQQRGSEVLVRLRLAIDRQQCAGYGVVVVPPSPTPTMPVTPAEHRAHNLNQRTKALQKRLSETTKLKSASDVERQWLEGIHACARLVHEISATGLENNYPFLFGLVQQALQTGPLCFGKPAQVSSLRHPAPLHTSLGHSDFHLMRTFFRNHLVASSSP